MERLTPSIDIEFRILKTPQSDPVAFGRLYKILWEILFLVSPNLHNQKSASQYLSLELHCCESSVDCWFKGILNYPKKQFTWKHFSKTLTLFWENQALAGATILSPSTMLLLIKAAGSMYYKEAVSNNWILKVVTAKPYQYRMKYETINLKQKLKLTPQLMTKIDSCMARVHSGQPDLLIHSENTFPRPVDVFLYIIRKFNNNDWDGVHFIDASGKSLDDIKNEIFAQTTGLEKESFLDIQSSQELDQLLFEQILAKQKRLFIFSNVMAIKEFRKLLDIITVAGSVIMIASRTFLCSPYVSWFKDTYDVNDDPFINNDVNQETNKSGDFSRDSSLPGKYIMKTETWKRHGLYLTKSNWEDLMFRSFKNKEYASNIVLDLLVNFLQDDQPPKLLLPIRRKRSKDTYNDYSFSLPNEVWWQVSERAHEEGFSVSGLVDNLICQFLGKSLE